MYNVKIADASMQFLKTLESSSQIALKYLYITVKLAVTLKSQTNRQLSNSEYQNGSVKIDGNNMKIKPC